MHQDINKRLLKIIFFQLFWLTMILLAARLTMFLAFVEPAQLLGKQQDLWRMWLTGMRYDLRIAGIVVAPWLLLGLGLAGWQPGWHLLRRCLPALFGLFAFIVAAVAIGNFFYYQTYHNHIDVFVFGLVEDDTQAVLANMWQDYPIIQSLLLALLLAIPSYWFTAVTLARTEDGSSLKPWSAIKFYMVVVLSIAVVFIAARGSIGTFPLRRANAQVSELTVLNKLTPNGLMAIDWAFKDRKQDIHFSAVTLAERDQLLQQLEFTDIQQHTPENPWLAQHPPHVVMGLLESFGSNMLAFDQPENNDLLGGLRSHFEHDFLFRRFLPQGNGTAPSLAALFFQSPAQNISHSSAQNKALPGTPFSVYKKAGYRIIFISPGNMMWRNLNNYLPVQGVDEIYDQNALMAKYPQARAELTDWGLPDEYAYRLAYTLLSEAKQPTFISILTVTNHPPYVVPDSYQPLPVAVTPEVKAHAEEGKIEQVNILRTFQYAADAFGNFVATIKNSPLASKTVIAATGDHQMRRVKANYPVEQVLDRAVPFYLYVPATLAQHVSLKFDPDRVGSHKDIFPTLYALSLSATDYVALGGRNMLAVADDPARAFGYNESVWIDEQGAYPLAGKVVSYPWAKAHSLLLADRAQPVKSKQSTRLQAYPQLLRWQLNAQIKGVIREGQPKE